MKYNVLLVEDDDKAAFLIKDFLKEYDLEIDIANTVTTAISNIKFKKYSLILLDINLPDFDGFEVLKEGGFCVAVGSVFFIFATKISCIFLNLTLSFFESLLDF